ncbi:TonB family protein [Heminiphilus faecis]|uniref:TonB family protein n=1 Tax=Heminiphilus faecis TaxID=2601703 RepID=A0ABV4CV77_9BACT
MKFLTMARGKQTCKILKEIRRQIAEANGIEFITSECRYRGDCLGTCPKCEAEVRYLEQQLRARLLAGKAVAIAGISAGMLLLSGCSGTSTNQSSETLLSEPETPIEQVEVSDTIEEGELPMIEDSVVIKKGEIDDTEYTVVGEIIDPEQEDKVYEAIVDVRPTFPGGDEKLMEWISQHIQYPQNAYNSHIQGRVIIQFLVNEDGSVGDAQIIRSVFPSLDEEALRVVTTLPKFNPAILDGKAVEYWFTIPIIFRLAD